MQEMTIEFTVAKFLNGFGKLTNGIVENLGSFDLISVIPDSVDMNKLGRFLENYIK